MRLPRLRFTLRTLMLIVAVMGVASAIVVLKQRRDHCLEQAQRYANSEVDNRAMEHLSQEAIEVYEGALAEWSRAGRRDQTEKMARQIAQRREALVLHGKLRQHYEQLREKYNKAAARPWLAVEPDPCSQIAELLEKLAETLRP